MPETCDALLVGALGKVRHGRCRILSGQELLDDWKWLPKKPHTLVAMNNFGDMFLRDEHEQCIF